MCKKRTILILSLVMIFLVTGCFSEEQTSTDKLVNFVNTEIGSDDKYWFKMQNRIDGSWNPVILIFGYANNESVCEHLLENAKETSPNVNFSCEEA